MYLHMYWVFMFIKCDRMNSFIALDCIGNVVEFHGLAYQSINFLHLNAAYSVSLYLILFEEDILIFWSTHVSKSKK